MSNDTNDKPAKPKPDAAKALEMRQAGASLAAIAAELGCSRHAAGRAVRRALARLDDQQRGVAKLAVAMEGQRIDFALSVAYKIAADESAPNRDRLRAVTAILAAVGVRQRLLGIGVPIPPGQPHSDPDPLPQPRSDAERVQAIQAILARANLQVIAAKPTLPAPNPHP
jgi:hypothetical protein